MSKQLSPLEALEILKEANTIYCGCASNLFARYRFEIETIETALKAFEIINEIFNFKVIKSGKSYLLRACGSVSFINETNYKKLKEVLK